MEEFVCKYCNKILKNKNAQRQHEIRCAKNPNHINTTIPNFNNSGRQAWNKGLTKEDPRIAKFAKTISIVQKGKARHLQTDETKAKISQARKKYIAEHPDKVPFKLNHSSKESYPERYFRLWLAKVDLLAVQELQVSRYTLDFAWPEYKVYLEIDGSQHKLDWMMEHDKQRTEFLSNLGWSCIHRVDWAEYKKLDKNSRHKYLVKLKMKIMRACSSVG